MRTLLDINGFRVGNYIDYQGQLGEFDFSKINAIDKIDEGTCRYDLTHKDKPEFVGYDHPSNEIRPITLTPSHLKKLGFSSNDNDSFFKYKDIGIIYTGYRDAEVFVLASMKIYKSPHKWPAAGNRITVEELKQNTVDINFVHYFQNYCSDRGWNIDFSALENMR